MQGADVAGVIAQPRSDLLLEVVDVADLFCEVQPLLELRDNLLHVGTGAPPGEEHVINVRVNDHHDLALVR